MQSVAFVDRNFDFYSGFAMYFGSTAKPQREAQKSLSDCIILYVSLVLLWFSKTHIWRSRVTKGQSSRQKQWFSAPITTKPITVADHNNHNHLCGGQKNDFEHKFDKSKFNNIDIHTVLVVRRPSVVVVFPSSGRTSLSGGPHYRNAQTSIMGPIVRI